MTAEISYTTQFLMDRAIPLGNSLDIQGRRALHTKVTNLSTEPIPVYVTDGPIVPQVQSLLFNQVLAVASGATTIILTYTVPAAQTLYVSNLVVGGQNIATYQLLVDASVIMILRTSFSGDLTAKQSFGLPQGLAIQSGSVITISVTNFRPSSSDFEASLFGVLAG